MTIPTQPAPAKGPGLTGNPVFWIVAVVGCLGVCGVLLVVGVGALGFFVAREAGEFPPPPEIPPKDISGSAVPGTPGTQGPDDFLYTSKGSGLQLIAPNQIVAEGVSVTLVGEWRDDHRNIILRLREGGRYELREGGGATGGTSKYELVASTTAEQGAWTFEGSTLTLAPDQVGLSGRAEGKSSVESGKAEGPRRWNVVGVTIEYTPHGSEVAKQRAGLRVTGPAPGWYYPSGEMNWVLRSAW